MKFASSSSPDAGVVTLISHVHHEVHEFLPFMAYRSMRHQTLIWSLLKKSSRKFYQVYGHVAGTE